jgi:hypothetical protein
MLRKKKKNNALKENDYSGKYEKAEAINEK